MPLIDLYNQPNSSAPASAESGISESEKKAQRFYEGLGKPYKPEQRPDEKIEVVLPPTQGFNRRTDFLWISEIPVTISQDLRSSTHFGTLQQNLDHWIGVLDGGDLVEKRYIQKLKTFRSRITGIRREDEPLVEEIAKVLAELRPAKVRS